MTAHGTAIMDKDYRYLLTRTWGIGPRVLWIMLNPSTADALKDDLTIKKCVGFAMRWGAFGIDVVNLFAFRSTQPHSLTTAPDPVGPLNNSTILSAISNNDCWRVVAAWGCDPHLWPREVLRRRPDEVLKLIQPHREIYCLGKTSHGSPKHPSRLAYNTQPIPYDLERGA